MDGRISVVSVEGLYNGCTYLEDDISRALPRERLVGFLDNIDVSGLGECDGFDGGRELGHS